MLGNEVCSDKRNIGCEKPVYESFHGQNLVAATVVGDHGEMVQIIMKCGGRVVYERAENLIGK